MRQRHGSIIAKRKQARPSHTGQYLGPMYGRSEICWADVVEDTSGINRLTNDVIVDLT
jgi:hypothetical protein